MSRHPDRIVQELDNFLSNPSETFANAYKHLENFLRVFESLEFGSNVRVDLTDENTHYEAIMDLPGVLESDITVDMIDNNVLHVKAGRTAATSKKMFVLQERSTSSYERKLSLPNDIDPTKISANYDNGVLIITVDKIIKTNNIRRIIVNNIVNKIV